MPAYTSKELSIMNAKAFVHNAKMVSGESTDEDTSSVKKSIILYAVLGNQLPYENEPTASTPIETDKNKQRELWRNAIGAKRITPGDISHVVPRYNWTSGTVYAQYRDTDTNLYTRPFYVLTDENNVYKCLYNNKGAVSTVKPRDFSTQPFTLSDGYTWKYMYSISLGEAEKFLTTTHMPVKTLEASDPSAEGIRQYAVQQAAVNGSIEVVETVSVGSGYTKLDEGIVSSATTTTITITPQNSPSPIDNYYNGMSLYINTGTGSGQLRRIIDYSGSTKTFVVNSAFTTVANTDSRIIVAPTVVFRGDGSGALAYAEVNSSGQIANVNIINVGSGYTEAEVLITSNSIYGSGATANAIISPVGGHGSDPVRELGGDKILLNAQFVNSLGVSANGNGFIPANTDFRTISILKDPILKCDANNSFRSESIANTSFSPDTLRLTTRLLVSYSQMANNTPINPIVAGETITHERARLLAQLGELTFITELSSSVRESQSMAQAKYGANGNVVFVKRDETLSDTSYYNVYLNSVQAENDRVPFTNDDILLKTVDKGLGNTAIAVVSSIKGPEANTYSGEFIYTENIQKVTRAIDQTEDIKIILDF